MSIQSNQIVISEENQLAAVYKKKSLKELHISRSQYHIGSIYVGELQNVLANINAAFITLDKLEKNGFIHIHRVLPKKLTQKTHSFDIKTRILVQVIKEPTGTKGPSLTLEST
jgi:ribonuclease E